MRRVGWRSLGTSALAAVLLAGSTAPAVASPAATASAGTGGQSTSLAATTCASAPKPSRHYLGLVAHDLPPSTTYLHRFVRAAGVKPNRWAHVFNSTLANVAKFSSKPILIAETAVGPFPRRARMISNFFAGLKRHRKLLGFTWFDLNKSENWQLEGDKPAVAAFKKAAPSYLRMTR